jgi:hypothetical protein
MQGCLPGDLFCFCYLAWITLNEEKDKADRVVTRTLKLESTLREVNSNLGPLPCQGREGTSGSIRRIRSKNPWMQVFMDDVVGIGEDVGHVKGYRGHVLRD